MNSYAFSRPVSLLTRLRRARWVHALQLLVFISWVMNPFPGALSYWTDTNNDRIKEEVANPPEGDPWWDQDADSDGLTNGIEAIFGSDPNSLDSDHDGLADPVEYQYSLAAQTAGDTLPYDPWNWDSDGNGFSDFDQWYQQIQGYNPVVNYLNLPGGPTWSAGTFFSYSDSDGDGIKNPDDSDPVNNDRDSDGILNWNEAAGQMDDATNGYVPPPPATDPGVIIGGNWYPTGTLDSDGDGTPNQLDPFPWGSHWYQSVEYGGAWSDRDNDNIPDQADPFPDGSYWYLSVEYGGPWVDQDGDGIPNTFDTWPAIPGSYWYQTTEYPGYWTDQDGDGIPDPADATPNGTYAWNGVVYAGPWVDQDNDGTPDAFDTWPTIAGSYSYNTTQYPGAWVDQDNDGVPDPADRFPTVSGSYWYQTVEYPGAWVDSDADSIPDAADATPNGGYWYNGTEYAGMWNDADADGIPDGLDATPNGGYWYNGTEYAGTWSDQDGDGVPDAQDAFPTTAGSYWYNGTQYPGTWADSDNDGTPDAQDIYPGDAWNGASHFSYNGSEYLGTWMDRDSDGVPDAADAYPDDPDNHEDNDHDGLSNYVERTQLGTDPDKADSDDDDLPDYDELYSYHTNPLAQKTNPSQLYSDYYMVNQTDSDADGIPDRIEQWYNNQGYTMGANTTDDARADFDSDGYTNLQAYQNGWSLIAHMGTYDYDKDGILDVLEDAWNAAYPGILSSGSAADAVVDYDGDGVLNFEEIALGMNPGSANSRTASVSDLQEWAWRGIIYGTWNGYSGSVPAEWNVVLDNDNTGAPDGLEAFVAALTATPELVTLPQAVSSTDYDGDGMSDAWEHRFNLNLRDAQDANANNDGDSLTNVLECQQGRDPLINDDPPPPELTLSGGAPNGEVGTAYSAAFTASGGNGSYSYSISGTLPEGLGLDTSSGVLSGTPVNGGTFEFNVSVSDSAGQNASQSCQVVITGLMITTQTLPNGTLTGGYTATLGAARGMAPYVFSVVEGSLPFGYELAANGTLTGLPDSTGSLGAGAYAFTVQVADSAGETATKALSLQITNSITTTGGGGGNGGGSSGGGGNNGGSNGSGSGGNGGGTGGQNTNTPSASDSEAELVTRSTNAGLSAEMLTTEGTTKEVPFDYDNGSRTAGEAWGNYQTAVGMALTILSQTEPHEVPAQWVITVERYDPVSFNVSVPEVMPFEGLQAEAEAYKAQVEAETEFATVTGPVINAAMVPLDKPWVWSLHGTREVPDQPGSSIPDGHTYRQRTWTMETAAVAHDKEEIKAMTGDAPLNWLNAACSPPSNPLSEAQWLALNSGGSMSTSASGSWTKNAVTEDGEELYFPSGGATEVRLRRKEGSAAALQQPVTRTFLRIKQVGSNITEVGAVTLTIEPGHKVSTSGTGPGAWNGSVVLLGKPDEENKDATVTDKLVPAQLTVYPLDEYQLSPQDGTLLIAASLRFTNPITGLTELCPDGTAVDWKIEPQVPDALQEQQSSIINGIATCRVKVTDEDVKAKRNFKVVCRIKPRIKQGATIIEAADGYLEDRSAAITAVANSCHDLTAEVDQRPHPALGETIYQISITAKDENGNPVRDGTPVAAVTDGLSDVVDSAPDPLGGAALVSQFETTDGMAKVLVKASIETKDEHAIITVDGVEHEVELPTTPLTFELLWADDAALSSRAFDINSGSHTSIKVKVSCNNQPVTTGEPLYAQLTSGKILTTSATVDGEAILGLDFSDGADEMSDLRSLLPVVLKASSKIYIRLGAHTFVNELPLISSSPVRICLGNRAILADKVFTQNPELESYSEEEAIRPYISDSLPSNKRPPDYMAGRSSPVILKGTANADAIIKLTGPGAAHLAIERHSSYVFTEQSDGSYRVHLDEEGLAIGTIVSRGGADEDALDSFAVEITQNGVSASAKGATLGRKTMQAFVDFANALEGSWGGTIVASVVGIADLKVFFQQWAAFMDTGKFDGMAVLGAAFSIGLNFVPGKVLLGVAGPLFLAGKAGLGLGAMGAKTAVLAMAAGGKQMITAMGVTAAAAVLKPFLEKLSQAASGKLLRIIQKDGQIGLARLMTHHGDSFALGFAKASENPAITDGLAEGFARVGAVLGELAENPATRHITTELAGLSDDALARALRGMARLAVRGTKIDNFVKLLKEDSLFTAAGARARFLQRMDDVASINGPSADWVRSVLSNENMKNPVQARGYLLEIICAAENKASLNPQRLSCEFSLQAKKVDPKKANSFGVDCDVLCNAIAWNCKAKVSRLAEKFRKTNLDLTKVENWELIINEHNAILKKELGDDIKAGFAFLGAQTNPTMLETLRQALIRIHGDAAEQYLKIYDL